MDSNAFRKRKADKSDFIWLAYLIFFLIEPIQRRSGVYWMECIVIIGIFLFLYITFLQACGETLRRVLVGLIWLMGVATLPMNGGATAFVIYASALLPYSVNSVPVVLSTIGAGAGLLALESWLVHFNLFTIFLNTFFCVIVGGSNAFFAQKARSDHKLHMAQEEIEALAAVAERERIARDLHDVLGHTLTVIMMKAELAGRLLDSKAEGSVERARAELADVEQTSRYTLSEVREAIEGYRAKGLLAEIDIAHKTLEAAGVALDSDAVAAKTAGLTASEETVLALALREAVTNIVRHARATTCRLRFVSEDGHRRLIVEDNGQNAVAHEGNGLRGMRERVEALGGHMQLESGGGTRLLIELPLQAQGAAS